MKSLEEKIMERLDNIDDLELKDLIIKLINERNNLEQNLKRDSLTGIYNRRILKFIGNYSIVAMCDIDDFKSINDNYGHDFGDEILKIVSNIIVQNVRSSDYVVRFGGDEFIIVFNNCNLNTVVNRMEKIQENLIKVEDLELTLSIGISEYQESVSLDDAIKKADHALYKSKNNGKKQIKVYKK
ncbi:MAG: GGDEF domain-containing protein [Bacilli bacterium]|nr:GGDEF domain-containing protein [Bacilli bacterium]